MRQIRTVGLMIVVLGFVVAAAQAAPLNLDMGSYPRVLAYSLSVNYDATYYDATHGRLLVGTDGSGDLTGYTGYPTQVWTSATSAQDINYSHTDDSGNYDVVFGFWAEIDHSGSVAVPVGGGLLATGDFDGIWTDTNPNKPSGYGEVPVVNLLDSNKLSLVGYGTQALLEFVYKEKTDETTPLALAGADIGVILSEVYDPAGHPITVIDYGSNFSGDGAAKMDAYGTPEPATLSMLALGGLVLAWRRNAGRSPSKQKTRTPMLRPRVLSCARNG